MRRYRRWLICLTGLFVLSPAVLAFQGGGDDFTIVRAGTVPFEPVPQLPGLEIAVLAGDPAKEGPYVLRVRFAPGVMTPPHFHSQNRLVTVLSGTWYAGIGEVFDPAATTALTPGSFMRHPAGKVHYDGARDEPAVVQITGLGPVETTFLGQHPQDGRP